MQPVRGVVGFRYTERDGGLMMSLVTWQGKLLLTNGKLTLGPAAAACCCETPSTGCQEITGDLTCIVNAPGCSFDGQEITLIDRSLGLGDNWWSGEDAIWLADCVSIILELACNAETGLYELTVTQVSGSTPCEVLSGTTESTVQTYPPLHLEFQNAIGDVGGCECCDAYPTTITFVIDP